MVSVMTIDKAPLESSIGISGLEEQVHEMKEAIELHLTKPELFEVIDTRALKGVILKSCLRKLK